MDLGFVNRKRGNPVLSRLGMCTYENDLESPVWMQKDIEPSNEEEKGQTRELSEDFRKNGKEENVRQRITSKTKPRKHTSEVESGNCVRPPAKSETTSESVKEHISYACSWETYIQGFVVSESSRRYISNLLMATAAARA